MAKAEEIESGPDQRPPDEVAAVQRFKNDPLGYVLFAFDWGKGDLAGETGPDQWQAQYLAKLGEACERQERTGGTVIRMAVASGNGAGKTALVSWVLLWWMSTRIEPQTVVTANTATQLETKTWRELAKWQRRCINGHWFQHTATRFYLKERAKTHFAAAVPWSPQRAEAFAGTHDHSVLFIFDEASGIDDIIWDTAEGAFTTPGCIQLVFGNPTRNSGRFREIWGRFRDRWIKFQVDTRTCKKAARKQIAEWIKDYGIDSDFVRVRVFGMFPRADSMQFISAEEVETAQAREDQVVENYPLYLEHPIVMGVDVARFGNDRTVMIVRQGPKIHEIRKFERLGGDQVVAQVIQLSNDIKKRLDVSVETVFVDTGGVGGPVADFLRQYEVNAIDVDFGAGSLDPRRFFNRTSDMWWEMREWIRSSGVLPDAESADGRDIAADLTGRQYGYAKDMLVQLEKKTDMKKRGLASPDFADALALTFAFPTVNESRETAIEKRLAEIQSTVGDAGASHMAF